MLTVAICDDEPYFVEGLRESLNQYCSARKIEGDFSVFTDAESLLSVERDFDLILMDLKLPGMDGMEAIAQLRGEKQSSQVIFITSYKDCAIQAFDVDAVHYLLKPVSDERLFLALDRSMERMAKNDCRTLTITKGNETRIIFQRDILYCEAIDHRIYIHLLNESYDYFGALAKLEKQLDSHFFRCHKSYIVNLTQVVSRQGDIVTMSGGGQALVSRRRQQEFARQLLRCVREELLK